MGTLPLFFSILSSIFFYPFLDVASFSFSFLGGCGCDSCFFLFFCLTRHVFYFLINWVIAFFFFFVGYLSLFVLIGYHFFKREYE